MISDTDDLLSMNLNKPNDKLETERQETVHYPRNYTNI